MNHMNQGRSLGVYIHVPFCARACDFCAFYQEAPTRSDIIQYLDGIEREFQAYANRLSVDTVFWGGGTPGLLLAKDLESLGTLMLDRFSQPPREWTIEMAPSTVKRDKIRLLRDMGVTRISLGVQSFSEEALVALGRLHQVRQVDQAIEMIQSEGFDNLNLDMMFALPGQSVGDWVSDLEEAARRQPTHLSTYCLSFEEDTILWRKMQKGEVAAQSEEEEIDFFRAAWARLASLGYEQYEISNYARPNWQCEHNLNTWRMHNWIGLGPSASSQYQGRRFTNPPSLTAWLKGLDSGRMPFIDEVELNDEILLGDSFIFGFRMNEGVSLGVLRQRFDATLLEGLNPFLEGLKEAGYLWRKGDWVGLTPDGRLLADRIGFEILETLSSLSGAYRGIS